MIVVLVIIDYRDTVLSHSPRLNRPQSSEAGDRSSQSWSTSAAPESDVRFSQVLSIVSYPFHLTRYCVRVLLYRCAIMRSIFHTASPLLSAAATGGGRDS